jgi:hypothetical protein
MTSSWAMSETMRISREHLLRCYSRPILSSDGSLSLIHRPDRKSEVPMTGRLAKVLDKVECELFQSLLQRRGEVLVLLRKWCALAASRIRVQSLVVFPLLHRSDLKISCRDGPADQASQRRADTGQENIVLRARPRRRRCFRHRPKSRPAERGNALLRGWEIDCNV